MITLKIKDIEKKLNKKIRKNAISLGWDVAERYTGLTLLKTNENDLIIEILDKIETNPKDDIKNRMISFINSVEKFKQDWGKYKSFRIVIIEDSWMGMNVFTLKSLVRFSTLLWEKFYKDCDCIDFMMPNSARAIIGFNKNRQTENTKLPIQKFSRGKNKGKDKKIDIKKLVQEYLKETFNVAIEDSDKSDSFTLALAGLLK
jgi:Holliday junction resolvasome RuvABC endonuclease subunit